MTRALLPHLLSIDQTARLLRVDYADASRAVSSGDLPSVLVDGRIAVPTYQLLVAFGVSATDAQARLSTAA